MQNMLRKLVNVALQLALCAGPAKSLIGQTGRDPVLADVRYLAADSLSGRGIGTPGLDAAACYIAWRFAAAGLRPVFDDYFQRFRLDPSAPALAHAGLHELHVKNVVGVVPGAGALAREAIVIGAHYDHLGLGGSGSLDPDSTGVVHNGADDNASGTAALIEAAQLLSRRSARSAENYRTLVFVAFTAEEVGLLGSAHYVRNPVISAELTRAMINFDMVGRLRENKLVTIGTGSADHLPALLDSINAGYGFQLSALSDPWGRSDHSSFYGKRIPVVHLFTDNHQDYHRTTDDWEQINVAGIKQIAAFAADLAWSLATRLDYLAYADVPQPPPTSGGGYGAYLGTIPDMSESPGGVRLTGVRSGSPADSAGMLGGDILVQLGEHEITNLYDMTDALRAHEPGDSVRIVVLRDGERIELAATLGRRGS